MRNSTSARRFASDVEITLAGDQVVESQIAILKPHQKVPNEVFAAGPEAVGMYTQFLARTSGRVSPVVEHIELGSVAA